MQRQIVQMLGGGAIVEPLAASDAQVGTPLSAESGRRPVVARALVPASRNDVWQPLAMAGRKRRCCEVA